MSREFELQFQIAEEFEKPIGILKENPKSSEMPEKIL